MLESDDPPPTELPNAELPAVVDVEAVVEKLATTVEDFDVAKLGLAANEELMASDDDPGGVATGTTWRVLEP